MRKRDGLSRAAAKVGAVVGRAEGTARKIAKAGGVAKKELDQISKQIEGLKRQLQKTTKRLKHALRCTEILCGAVSRPPCPTVPGLKEAIGGPARIRTLDQRIMSPLL